MEKFNLHVLGCGSAQPTLRHHQTSQVLNIHEKLFMIDCGEGTQQQLRTTHLSFSRLNHIFISHLHGDHCFGLIGLISTFSLLGRTKSLHVYAPSELEGLMRPQLQFFCNGIMAFDVVFHPFSTKKGAVIYEDRTISVETIPLQHRMPCCGFIFREKPALPHIKRDMIDYLGIPHFEINRIKLGGDWTKADGTVVPHHMLVNPPRAARSYAYLSDTAFLPERAPLIKNVSVLFHEATFATSAAARATQTMHSTAAQAAQMAKLANCGKLIIGHFSSRYENEDILLEESREIFPNTMLAYEGMQLEIGNEQ